MLQPLPIHFTPLGIVDGRERYAVEPVGALAPPLAQVTDKELLAASVALRAVVNLRRLKRSIAKRNAN